jgi:hypothetical protein
MAVWLPYALAFGEAIAVGIAAYSGAIPGVPAGNWQAALALAVAKLMPGGLSGQSTTSSVVRLASPKAALVVASKGT